VFEIPALKFQQIYFIHG